MTNANAALEVSGGGGSWAARPSPVSMGTYWPGLE